MIRCHGVNIPDGKHVCISLTYIYGVGRTMSHRICASLSIDPTVKVRDLSDNDLRAISDKISSDYIVEGDLRRIVQRNIKSLSDMGSYRGLRHRVGLSVRGQRTSTNCRTRKGRAKPIAGKKK